MACVKKLLEDNKRNVMKSNNIRRNTNLSFLANTLMRKRVGLKL